MFYFPGAPMFPPARMTDAMGLALSQQGDPTSLVPPRYSVALFPPEISHQDIAWVKNWNLVKHDIVEDDLFAKNLLNFFAKTCKNFC